MDLLEELYALGCGWKAQGQQYLHTFPTDLPYDGIKAKSRYIHSVNIYTSQNLKDYKEKEKIRAGQIVFHSVMSESHAESLQT